MAGNTWATGCRGKMQYPSRKMAAAAIRRMRREGAAVAPETLEPYRCAECKTWHIGHSVRPRLPAPLKIMRAREGDVVQIVWRRVDGAELTTSHEMPKGAA